MEWGATRQAYLGPDHPDTARCMATLGFAYRGAGRRGQAVSLLEDTLNRYETVFGPNHSSTCAQSFVRDVLALNPVTVTHSDPGRDGRRTCTASDSQAAGGAVLEPDRLD
jgi:hypothetical protein